MLIALNPLCVAADSWSNETSAPDQTDKSPSAALRNHIMPITLFSTRTKNLFKPPFLLEIMGKAGK